MSFSKDVIISLVILAVVLEADLGRKKVGWFRIARPFIVGAAIVPSYLSSLPTSGNSLGLQGIGALLGILLGLTAVSPAFVRFGFDPDFRGWWARLRHRPGHPTVVSRAGSGYALVWIAATVARLAFAWLSEHAFPHALGVFLVKHQISADALTNALIFWPLGMDIFRSLGLWARGSGVRRRADVEAPGVQAR